VQAKVRDIKRMKMKKEYTKEEYTKKGRLMTK